MYSVLAWRAPSKAPMVERRQVGPIAVQWVWVHRGSHTPQWVLRRRVNRAVAYLQSQRITQGVVPSDMVAEGIDPISTVSLRERLAPTQLGWQLQDKGVLPHQATVAVVAQRLRPVQGQIVEQLALTHRHLLLQAQGAEALCQRLRRYYGVAVQCNPGLPAMERCDGGIAFAPWAGVGDSIVTYDETVCLPPLRWPESWAKPTEVSTLEGWAMVAHTGAWQDDWSKLAFLT